MEEGDGLGDLKGNAEAKARRETRRCLKKIVEITFCNEFQNYLKEMSEKKVDRVQERERGPIVMGARERPFRATIFE